MQPPWRSMSGHFPHRKPQIERTAVDQQPLDDVVVMSKMGSPHGPRFVHMREASLDSFSTLPEKS